MIQQNGREIQHEVGGGGKLARRSFFLVIPASAGMTALRNILTEEGEIPLEANTPQPLSLQIHLEQLPQRIFF